MKRILIGTIISMLLICVSCSKGYSKGDRVHTNKECFSAVTKSCYDVMTDFSVERNGSAIQSMIDDGEVYVLPSYTHGKVTDYKTGVYEVDFDGYGKLWVASEFIGD